MKVKRALKRNVSSPPSLLENLQAWVRLGESEILEFKRTTNERREAVRSLCAMINHRGGRVLFGVSSAGEILGQQVSDRTIEELAQEIKEIDPPVFPSIERIVVSREREAIAVTVLPGPSGPYTYKGRAYRRVGNASLAMSKDECNRILLERLHGQSRWENQLLEEWSVKDLDIGEITRTIDESVRRGRSEDPGTRDPEIILRGLGLMKGKRLFRAAAVLFGRRDLLAAEYPQCLLRVARFRGSDKTVFVDNRQFQGNVFDLLSHAERFLRDNLPVAGRVLPGLFERVDDPLYPSLALRESLANAFCHRDYSMGGGSVSLAVYDDRLEITSSGPLHFGLTEEMLFLPHESLPWNPLIARTFYRRGIIESWGRGTLKMAELMHAAGLPHPEIVEASGCVIVRFRPKESLPLHASGDLNAQQKNIIALIVATPIGLSLRDIRKGIPSSPPVWKLKRELETLKNLGKLATRGRGLGARWLLRKEPNAP
ncbi:MAG: putative DNA binding domain-containing protein [Elusimicrobia bacterium]|nr:putative DNA binding domain-containing protein [Elusimicrobiota bacterium]